MDGLKKRRKGSITVRAKKYVDSIMSDGQPRTHIKIIDDMKELINTEYTSREYSRPGDYLIPTINELQYYLIHNYTKVGRDKFTNYLIYQKK